MHFVLLLSLLLLPLSSLAKPEVVAEIRLRGMTFNGDHPQDLRDLRGLGANVATYQLVWPGGRGDGTSIPEYFEWLHGRLDVLDGLIPAATEANIKIVVVLHTPPGGFSTFLPVHRHAVFDTAKMQEQFLRAWETIASRYAGVDAIYAYDLLNEPAYDKVAPGILGWSELADKAIKIIRKYSPDVPVMIEVPYGDPANFKKLKVSKLPRVIYNFHAYYPQNFREQGLGGKPIGVIYPRKGFTRKQLNNSVKRAIAFQKKSKMPMFVGEFSAPRWAPKNSGFRYLRDYITVFERSRWSWTYHGWREAHVWSIEHSEDPADFARTIVPTQRQLLMEKYFRKNKQ